MEESISFCSGCGNASKLSRMICHNDKLYCRECFYKVVEERSKKMKLAIYDDGKGKSQSWEVSLGAKLYGYEELLDIPTFNFLSIIGYGATKQEAIDEFKKDFKASVENVMKILDELNENNFEEIMVDCFGNPIKEQK